MKSVVIQSIGEAKPSVAALLSDVLSVPSDVVLKMLYQSPSVLFRDVEDELAHNAQALLLRLGLQATVEDSVADLQEAQQLYDVALHLNEPLDLFRVQKALADFLGCTEQQALQLLLKNPAIVLGSVSQATALALSERLGAKVLFSNPRKASYTLLFRFLTKDAVRQFQLVCDKLGIAFTPNVKQLNGLPYEQAQELWRHFGAKEWVQLYNEQFLSYRILLESFDLGSSAHCQALTDLVGMPSALLPEVWQQLPLVIHDYLDDEACKGLIAQYQELGISCTAEHILEQESSLHLEEIEDTPALRRCLSVFFAEKDLRFIDASWMSPHPLPLAYCRFLAAQLEALGQNVNLINPS